jgi:hypothetical protein
MTDWHEKVEPNVTGLDVDERARLSVFWREAGAEAHAAVASYSMLSLQLMAIGTGPDLLFAAHQAAIDEVRRTRLCFALASAYAGEKIEPTISSSAIELDGDAVALAQSTLRDGCIGAARRAQAASQAMSTEGDAAVAKVFGLIATDQAKHVAMSWDVVALCIETGGEPVKEALRAVTDVDDEVSARLAKLGV